MSVPLSTIKSGLRIDYDDDDTELTRLREAAESLVLRRTGLTIAPATKTLYVANWRAVIVPEHPYTSLTSVTYYDGTNTLTTMPSTDYWVDRTDGPMPVLRFLDAPALYEGTAITVTYVAGYTVVPSELTHAIIALVGHWYNNPEAASVIQLNHVPMSLEYIIDNIGVRSPLR
jgi:uncharacterized phiE125 gp8 family phage protein